MIGILNRWRQFGRRYFWPHLLLGMVAATLGVPQSLTGSAEQSVLPSTLSSLNRQNSADNTFDKLALLQEVQRRSTLSVDYWQQHALRIVIRHLSFSLAPQVTAMRSQETAIDAVKPPLQEMQLALLSTLNTLLMYEPKPAVIVSDTLSPSVPPLIQHQVGLWLAQIQGIRAGPDTLC